MYVKPEAAITVFELLMMGGVSPETCCASKKHWNKRNVYLSSLIMKVPDHVYVLG
jgi:hypothetical protein